MIIGESLVLDWKNGYDSEIIPSPRLWKSIGNEVVDAAKVTFVRKLFKLLLLCASFPSNCFFVKVWR